MAKDIDQRLAQLRARRTGSTVSLETFAKADSVTGRIITEDAADGEAWETRGGSGQRWTRYALGAMAAVGDTYTRVSMETGEKIANQLRDRLAKAGLKSEFEFQGSVPLNVHIKRVSDVDLLAITTTFKTYDSSGSKARQGHYGADESDTTSSEVLRSLRTQVETDLADAFPKATIDKTGAKAVKISGASLPRFVDVVPAHWLDTVAYQDSGRKSDRGVRIYNKKTGETIKNQPFLHIDRISSRCDTSRGGLRKSIRLCKSVKSDSDRDIELSSFDIASIMYYADMTALRLSQYTDLAVLAETQRHLDAVWRDQAWAGTLMVPDGSRKIFDTPEKRGWLGHLSLEMDELLSDVYLESAVGKLYQSSPIEAKRELVKSLQI